MAEEAQIEPNDDGTRARSSKQMLDRNGHLVDDPENSYTLYGTVVLGGQTFSGLLLEGKPTAFGAHAVGSAPVAAPASAGDAAVADSGGGDPGKDVFDLNMKITGGALAGRFGPALYMRIIPRADDFDGQFNRDFSGRAAKSNTRAYQASKNVAEPSTLLILLACGAGLAVWRRGLRIFGG